MTPFNESTRQNRSALLAPSRMHHRRNGTNIPAKPDDTHQRKAHPVVATVSFGVLIVLVTFFTSFSCVYANSATSESDQTLIVGGNSDFAPYEYINARGEPDGYTVDLIRAVGEKIGRKVEITLSSWQTARQKLEDRQIDLLTGVLYSQEREKVFDFSVPHIVLSYAIFVRRQDSYRSVEDLQGKEVIVVADVYAHDWLRTNRFTPHIVAVKRPEIALQLLSEGQHDFAVLPRLHGLELIRSLKIDNIDTVGPPVLSQKFCFAVAAGNADLLAQLNEGLVQLQMSGEYDRIYLKWFSVYEQRKHYLRLAARIAIPLILVILIVFGWNLSLKKIVARQTVKLRQKETLLTEIIQSVPIATFVIDQHHLVTHWNNACENLTGIPAADIVGTRNHASAFYGNDQQTMGDLLLGNKTEHQICQLMGPQYRPSPLVEGACEAEFFFSQMGLTGKWLCGTAALIRDADGRVNGAIESWLDLTDHKQLEAQLIQSQKMEAIGTLAGGLSHDFGNFLTAIMGHAEMARRKAPPDGPVAESIKQVLNVCEHAKNLIKRLLTFSRQTEVTVKTVRIDHLVSEALDLIKATLPSSIEIRASLDCQVFITVDATQMHQILMNLCTNAAHAMKGLTGTLTITLNQTSGDTGLAKDETKSGQNGFVKLSVSDTGHGIPADIVDRIFDPFFTTKERTEGTGMGLSVSHGIVKRFGGTITVDSRPGQGATFNIYWPVAKPPADHSIA